MTKSSTEYHPEDYWNHRVDHRATLASVGQQALGGYNLVAYRFRRKALLKAIRLMSARPTELAVFEAGFGVGFYLRVWKSLGIRRVTAADLSSAAVANGRLAFPEYELLEHNIVQLLPGSRRFDLVTAVDILYHIVDDADWERAVINLASLLRVDGYMLITDKFPADAPYQVFPHVRRRPLSWYTRVLKSCGLIVEQRFPVFILMDDALPVGRPRWLARSACLQWRVVAKAIRTLARWPWARDAAGIGLACLQYPFELLATSCVPNGPNLEMLVIRKSGDSPAKVRSGLPI